MSCVTALIFAKYPQPGAVNTRMVPPLTAEEAAALHMASLLAVCERASSVSKLEVRLVVTPDDRVDRMARLCNQVPRVARREEYPGCGVAGSVHATASDVWPQGDGDLGERLARASSRAFDVKRAAGPPPRGRSESGVLLLGADSPTLPASFLTRAAAELDEHDAVLGPCDDGGYYLLGLRRPLPELFERINWGADDVADRTRRRAASAGIDLRELPPWYDLDRFDDLKRAARDLADMVDPPGPATIELCHLIRSYLERSADGRAHQT